ncbi:hypothetical protein [Mucilaginibacter sp. FT3.2]|uniref:hypothetical protein n=1 Tax=Mucilaginibacter sp. FT3.2 TaxID=2723090 RepID=UPI0016228A57|nr:hypothetical protein [Mucilaginibacter sp. FT3.2]MBB6230865.1 hypothetical protein [Mucilaginibacter sp. FT3.2]
MPPSQSPFEQLFDSITKIEPDKGYWFIRTDSGQHFEEFYVNGYIGIGWNYITADNIKNLSISEFKEKIALNEKLDMSVKKSKGKVTAIYNKIKRFQELKKNDLVIIPSRSSSRFAFGIVEESGIYIESDPKGKCDYRKRKKIKWIESKTLSSLDPIFYQITVSRHAISSIKKYQNYIDNETENLYVKDGFGHFVFDIKTKKDINVDSLVSFIESIRRLTEQINQDFSFGEDISKSSIKLNLQSPGKIDFKAPIGKSVIILAAILALSNGCTIDSHKLPANAKDQIEGTMALHKDTISSINKGFKDLDVNMDKINAIN